MSNLTNLQKLAKINEEMYYSGHFDTLPYEIKEHFYWHNVIALQAEVENLTKKAAAL